ncbi:MAG: M23 family metallopeptidase [Dysgonamonadaceae bacterium]|jgi:hypothetical protein|nr:M23 family metallopeptidase [Dysgonamonadaceae bacterium]
MQYPSSKKILVLGCVFHFFIAGSSPLFAQSYQNPLNIPPALSANFGELRNNHFHSGLDFKTQGVSNKAVFAVADGYVSRILISPSGYGLALYITHPATGHTSVYGHLNDFSKPIADYAKQKQYELESFRVDLTVPPDVFPVKKGQQIALSGNTGGSGGPHLHFEIRDTESEEAIDPLKFYHLSIADTQKPDIRGIAIYPAMGKGVVNNATEPFRTTITKSKAGVPQALKGVSAWGKIGVGVKAYDRMNGQNNVYGVKTVRLFVDGKQVFGSSVNRFSFNETRLLNSFIDFEDWRERNSFFMQSFVEQGNSLPFYQHVANGGYIVIDEERPYELTYELEDAHGNTTTYTFGIEGKRAEIPSPDCPQFMASNLDNSVVHFDFSLYIPTGNLYSNFCFHHGKIQSLLYFSDIYIINDKPVPLHRNVNAWIKLKTDSLDNRAQYGAVKLDKKGNAAWVGGVYKNGGVEFKINELGGRYAIDTDSIAPQITPIDSAKWIAQKRIRLRLTDDKSGVSSFRGTINGEFVLFSHDVKSKVYTYVFDAGRLTRGKQELVFRVSDGVGNEGEYRYEFDY